MTKKKQQQKPQLQKEEKKLNNLVKISYFGTATMYQYASPKTGKVYTWRKDSSGKPPRIKIDIADLEDIKNIKGKGENPNRTRQEYLFG